MSIHKAVIDFTPSPAAELLPLAKHVHDSLNAVASTFPNLPVSIADLGALIGQYEVRLSARASRATADMIAFDLIRHELEDALGQDGDYINGVANGDLTLIQSSGYPHYEARFARKPGPPAAPTDVRLRHGEVSGTVVARYKPDRRNSMNEVQTCAADPNTEANWKYFMLAKGGKATLVGLTPATTVWVRVRTAGAGGVMGAWSDPAKIIVT